MKLHSPPLRRACMIGLMISLQVIPLSVLFDDIRWENRDTP